MLDRIQLKAEAKAIVRGARVSAYRFTLVYLVLVGVLNVINRYTSGEVVLYLETLGVSQSQIPAFLLLPLDFPPLLVGFVGVLASLISTVLAAGYAIYHLGIRRGYEMEYGTLFDGFSFVGKVILLQVVQACIIVVGTILFVIPGLIAAYRYRFSLYNLCENPEMRVVDAMRMSGAQTRGHKLDLFILDLTFYGWSLLCALTLNILSIWISPYMTQTNVGYFQQLKRMKNVGWFPPEEQSRDDGTFHSQDPFST